MSVEDTIFRGLTHENENAVTELLVNMMWIDEDTRKKILTTLLKETEIQTEGIKKNDISTQVQFSEKEKCYIPDIIIQNDKYFVVIENKITRERDLEETQRSKYIKLIQDKKNQNIKSAYIFLVPKGSVSDIATEKLRKSHPDDSILICHWSDLLNELDKLNGSIIKECVKYIKSLVFSNEVEKNLLGKLDEPSSIHSLFKKKNNFMGTAKFILTDIFNSSFEINSYDNPPCAFGASVNTGKKTVVCLGYDLSFQNTQYKDYTCAIYINDDYIDIEKLKNNTSHHHIFDGRTSFILLPITESESAKNIYNTIKKYLANINTKSPTQEKTVDRESFEGMTDYQKLLNNSYGKIIKISQTLHDQYPSFLLYADQYDAKNLGTSRKRNFKNKIGKLFNYKDSNGKKHNSSIFIGFDFTLAESKPDYVFCLAVKKDILKDSSGLEKTDTYNLGNTTFSQSHTGDYYFYGEWLYHKLNKELLSQSDDKLSSKIKSVLEDLKLLQKTQDETKGAN